MMYCQRSPAGKLYSKIRLRPQKPAYMRMDGGKTTVRPQKQPFLRMDCSFLILVDYLDVLSLGKVDSVYKL